LIKGEQVAQFAHPSIVIAIAKYHSLYKMSYPSILKVIFIESCRPTGKPVSSELNSQEVFDPYNSSLAVIYQQTQQQ
jgi:hypothetical protein